MNILFFSGHGLELKGLAAARPPQVSMTDVVPCDCVLLQVAYVANEATISRESVPQMKDPLPQRSASTRLGERPLPLLVLRVKDRAGQCR